MAHLANLNPAQLSAVTAEAEVLQVLAPPGSGKTKTLTSRVAHLLGDRGFLPWNVICLTFTIKSAREMKERVAKLIGEDIGGKVILGTFHSVCRRYLSYYGHLIQLRKGFGIADTSDTTGIVTRIIKRNRLNIEAKQARSRISSCKARNVGWEQALRETTGKKQGVDQHEFVTVYQQYEEHLELSNLLDYDDLLLRCLQLLQRHPECVKNVEAVLIDEFQDTNFVQFDLMNLFAQRRKRITTVGDPDQSIYGWRNAEVTNLTKMQTMWPETLVINLEQNYRSAGAILELAQILIEQDTSRPQKALAAVHRRGTAPVLRKLPNAAAEAEWIVSEIKRTMVLSAGLLDYSDYSVLLRSSSLSRQIESAFGKHGIPYRMVGGVKFFDRIEVKILLDYLRVIAQPDNSDALARVINVPGRKIGPATIKAFMEEAAEDKCTIWRIVKKAAQNQRVRTKLNAPQLLGVQTLMNIIRTAQEKLDSLEDPPTPRKLLEFLVKKLDFRTYLTANHKEDHEIRWENVEQLFAQTDDPVRYSNEADPDDALPEIEDTHQETPSGAREALVRFLANVALSTELQTEEDTNADGSLRSKVTISTIHAAKGLEWPIVFIPACYQGNIPHSRNENGDEERRLLYVAMTRAQASLYLSCPTRNFTGDETILSSFVDDSHLRKRFDEQGHMLEYNVIADMASILGRECPHQDALVAAMRNGGLERLLDDRWPLDGSPEVEENDRLWTNTHDSVGFKTAFNGAKRRKVSEQEAGVAAQDEVRSMLYSNTTMGSSAKLTISSQSIGFMSATQHMQIQRGIDAANGKTEESVPSTSLTEASKEPTKATKSSKPRPGKREAGQSSLSSWFDGGRPSAEHPEPVADKTKPAFKPALKPEPFAQASAPQLISGPSLTPYPRKPGVPTSVNHAIPASSLAGLRKPLVVNSMTGNSAPKPRSFGLSKPQPMRHSRENDVQEAPEEPTDAAIPTLNVTRAAVTTHSTTVSRLGQPQVTGARRLGMKGPIKPWNARGGLGGVRPGSFGER